MDLYTTLGTPASSLNAQQGARAATAGSAANYANRQPPFPNADLPSD